MADFKSYLAASILTEDKVVTYRLLSRVLKVHVNAAKEMLFEFHRVQNGKKPGTIHATYLIAGTKRKETPVTIEVQKDGEDDYMQSSPFVGSSMPQSAEPADGSILSITLTREENLDSIRSQFDHISSIHIYSLGPHPLKELQLLSDSTREIQTLSKSEDPLETYHSYGIITNPNTKRRTRKAPPIAAAPPTSVPSRPAAAKSKLNEVQEAPKSSSTTTKKAEPKSQPSNAKDFFGSKGKEKDKSKSKSQADSTKTEPTSAPSSKESTPAPPANLKRESSSIFKAFAKTQPKKAKIEEADSSAKDDAPMKDVSDDDDEDTWMPAPVTKETKAKDRNSRKEAQERLRKMMEDDEEEEAAPPPAPETPVEEEPEEEKEPEEVKEEEPVASTSNGRRRGRRRVMKKRTVKDEDGYLVTKQEQAWESFSEDEPFPPPKAKIAISNTGKGKKDAPKKGQGSIMSFFGKK